MTASRYRIVLLPQEWQFDADGDRPLLASAEDAGIVLPRSCRNGTCRTCMCRMTSGTVEYRIEWPGLLREERAAGWILPCVAHPAADMMIEAPAAHRFED